MVWRSVEDRAEFRLSKKQWGEKRKRQSFRKSTNDAGRRIDAAYAAGDMDKLRRELEWCAEGLASTYKIVESGDAGSADEGYVKVESVNEAAKTVAERAMTKLGRYKPREESRFYSWVSVVIRRELSDLRKHLERKANREELDEQQYRSNLFDVSMSKWAKRVSGSRANSRYFWMLFEEALGKPGKRRERRIHEMRMDGATFREIARKMRIKEATVRQAWKRFLVAFEKFYREQNQTVQRIAA